MQTAEAGYSKVLINEIVVPDVRAAWPATSLDFVMMALGPARERTEKEWRELLRSVGLTVVGIWTYEQGTESLIECELKGGENYDEKMDEKINKMREAKAEQDFAHGLAFQSKI